jgi:hypothetical protein
MNGHRQTGPTGPLRAKGRHQVSQGRRLRVQKKSCRLGSIKIAPFIEAGATRTHVFRMTAPSPNQPLRVRNESICYEVFIDRTKPDNSGGFREQRPTVGAVPHFAPFATPPLGQNTETNVSFASQLTEPSACTARRGEPGGPGVWAGAYLPSKYPRINSRLRTWRRILRQSPLRLPGITGDRECCAPAYSRDASCPSLNACRPSFHSLQLSDPLVRSARPR